MRRNLSVWRESASLILAAKSVFAPSSARCDYKVLCLKRSPNSAFMPGAYVFPGGNLAQSDCTDDWWGLYRDLGVADGAFVTLEATENVPAILREPTGHLPKYLSMRLCAIRETFEECGILLAKSPLLIKRGHNSQSKWASFIGGHDMIEWQHKVHNDSGEFLNLCRQFEVYPDLWALKNWSNWMTPPSFKSRFNTIFFLAVCHQTPTAHVDSREVEELMWDHPDNFLTENSKKLPLPIPQFYELSRLRTIETAESLAEFADEHSRHGCETYWPFRVKTDEAVVTILPGDDLYPETIDKDNTEVTCMDALPASGTMNRIVHRKSGNELVIRNFTPKCGQLAPNEKTN